MAKGSFECGVHSGSCYLCLLLWQNKVPFLALTSSLMAPITRSRHSKSRKLLELLIFWPFGWCSSWWKGGRSHQESLEKGWCMVMCALILILNVTLSLWMSLARHSTTKEIWKHVEQRYLQPSGALQFPSYQICKIFSNKTFPSSTMELSLASLPAYVNDSKELLWMWVLYDQGELWSSVIHVSVCDEAQARIWE